MNSVQVLTNYRPLRILLTLLACLIGAVILGIGIAKGGVGLAGALVAGPPALVFGGLCFKRPTLGLYTCLLLGFFLFSHSLGALVVKAAGPSFSIGLLLDGCLLMSILGVLVTAQREDWAQLHHPLLYMLLVWFLYNVFQLINPEAVSREPWFFAVRGFSLYWLQVTIIGLICLTKRAQLNRFITLWQVSCLVQALWSFKQQYLGLTSDEADWIENVARSTHVINGTLRCFSFCPDAGQFGAVMAHATVYAIIRMMDEPVLTKKIGYGLLTVIFFWGFAVAGSRGPLVVIVIGFAIYLLLKRNVVLFIAGSLVAGMALGVLKYTTIGQGNSQVQRMRSALDPEDPSLQLRLYNQQLFATYLATRPFGVGLGLAGDSGKRYSSTIVTQQGIDSWYVKIWVETGVIGLVIHLTSLLVIAVMGFRKVFALKDPRLRSIMSGLLCGYIGILVASYGNQLFGQSPTCFIMYLSILFFIRSDRFDQIVETQKAAGTPALKL